MRRLRNVEIRGYGLRFERWERGLFHWVFDDNATPMRYFFSEQCLEVWKERTGFDVVYPGEHNVIAGRQVRHQFGANNKRSISAL